MKTLLDQATRDELIERISSLDSSNTAQWGKMNLYQMTRHCTYWNEWVFGKGHFTYKQELLGLIFGRMALKSFVKDERILKKGMPAGKNFTIREQEGDIEFQKKYWAEQVNEYARLSNPAFVHDFFGKMTPEQIGIFAYKHFDHHLRQFNA